ncbi:MAG: FecR domain-containing protein [Chloroflexi bacterium]|nr:FecR domain-containing protein [Chloroflexota bacterium]
MSMGLLASACGGAVGARSASLSEILNLVQARLNQEQNFFSASAGTNISVGGQVRTGDQSRVRLDFSDQSIVRLGANTLLTVDEIDPGSDPIKHFEMQAGRIWISIFGGSFQVDTPAGTTTVRGSHAYVDLDRINCVHGTCIFRNQFFSVTFFTMEGIILLDGGRSFIRATLTDADVDNFPPSTSATLTAEARPRTATRTQTPTTTPTQTRTATPTSTATTTLTPTTTLTIIPLALVCSESPVPFDPPSGKAVNARTTVFRWNSNYVLKPNEVFDILVWPAGSAPASIGTTRDKNFSADLQTWKYAGAFGNYNWAVQVRRADGVTGCSSAPITFGFSAPPAAVPPTAVPKPTAVPTKPIQIAPCTPGPNNNYKC